MAHKKLFKLCYDVRDKVDNLELFVAKDHGKGWGDVQLRVHDRVVLVPQVQGRGDVDHFGPRKKNNIQWNAKIRTSEIQIMPKA